MEFPQIVARRETVLSQWVTLLEKDVRFHEGGPTEIYHSLRQADYVAVLAVTPDGRVPLVRQFRPAVEAFTWELPAGTVDAGESPARAVARELLEETGLEVEELHLIGSYLPDSGRLSLRSSGFFARCRNNGPERSPEPGLELRYVSVEALLTMVRSGEFPHQMHVALLASALVHGHLSFGDSRYNHQDPCAHVQASGHPAGPESPR